MGQPDIQVEDVFCAAVELPSAAARAAYLDRVCGDDVATRRRVERLLQAHTQAGNFLGEGPPAFPDTAAGPAEQPGIQIGPYKLLQRIGEGGMGAVWMAEQTRPVQRKVALKIIKAGMDSKQVVARFEAERQALALMEHPNIAKVFDAGTIGGEPGGVSPGSAASPPGPYGTGLADSGGRPYFVMELVKGQPITTYCDEHHLILRQRLELFLPVCQAIQHAHHKGVIHRDIKPSNVLVAPYDGKPVVKIIDFGVAKATGQRLTDHTLFTEFGAVVGTLEYMSPEQAELNNQDIDTRSDVYALGVLLYELLTGTTPLNRERLKQTAFTEMLRMIREEEPMRPSTRLSATAAMPAVAANRGLELRKLSGMVRGELDWITLKALEKDRNRRYETANGFARDIERYLADEPVQACPPSTWYRVGKIVRRHKALFATALSIMLTLVAATIAVTWKWRDAEQARKDESIARTAAEASETQAVAAERTARLREADALVGQARGTRLSHRPGQRFEALAALEKASAIGRELGQPAAWFDRLRNEAVAALALPDLHITRVFGQLPPDGVSVSLSDDFELYVVAPEKGDCTVHRVADDAVVARLPNSGWPCVVEFGPARLIAIQGPSRFQLWDLGKPEPVRRLDLTGGFLWDFDSQGRLLALASADGVIRIHEIATGKLVCRCEPVRALHAAVRFHPTRPLLAVFAYQSRDVWLRDVRTGALVASASSPWSGGNGYGGWSPDGRTLLVPQGDGTWIQEFALDDETSVLRPIRVLKGMPFQGAPAIAFNPSGDRFVSRGWSNTVNLVDAISGRQLFETHSISSGSSSVANYLHFDRSGRWLAGAVTREQGHRVGLWSVADGREHRNLTHGGSAHAHGWPAIHPDSRLAAVGHSDGVTLFDLASGRNLAALPVRGKQSACFGSAGNLFTNGFNGCYRWPLHRDAADPNRWTIGPPERLPFYPGYYPISASDDGRVVAQAMFNGYGMSAHAGGWVLHPNSPKVRCLNAGASTNYASVSPDGRWVAFGRHGQGVEVFDAATGRRVWKSPAPGNDYCRFSRDGQWLLTALDGGRAFATDTWKPGPMLGPGAPFDTLADSAIVNPGTGSLRLVELTTGRELVRLEDPEMTAGRPAFTPDGVKLVVEVSDGLCVWDLPRVRAGLAKLCLDWDAPALPNADDNNLPALEVTVRPGWEEVADRLRTKGDLAGTLTAIRTAHAADPDDHRLQLFLSWVLAICPDPKLRDAGQAVALAKRAVEAEPNNVDYLRTLGVAQHFAGNDQEAVAVLKRSLELRSQGEAFDYFPLAAALHRLGQRAEARQWYDRGVTWSAAGRHLYLNELAILRADAEAALGIAKPGKTSPAMPPAD